MGDHKIGENKAIERIIADYFNHAVPDWLLLDLSGDVLNCSAGFQHCNSPGSFSEVANLFNSTQQATSFQFCGQKYFVVNLTDYHSIIATTSRRRAGLVLHKLRDRGILAFLIQPAVVIGNFVEECERFVTLLS